jgi:hypothetical protein
MTFTPAPPVPSPKSLANDGGHIYGLSRTGAVVSISDIIGKNGKVRRANVRDLRAANKDNPLKVVKGEDTVEVIHAMESVTTLLGILDKKGLKDWWNRLLIETVVANPRLPDETTDVYVQRVLQVADQGKMAAAALGSKIHKGIEDAIDGKDVDSDVHVYVHAAMEKLLGLGIKVSHSEVAVYNQTFAIAGRLDLAGLKGGRPCILDFKSRKTPNSYPTDSIQIAAYGVAMFGLGKWLGDGIGINVILDTTKPGDCEAIIHDLDTLNSAWLAWQGLVNLYVHEKNFDPRSQ